MFRRPLLASTLLGLATTIATSLFPLIGPEPVVTLTAERDGDPSRGEGPGFVAIICWTSVFSTQWQSVASRERFCYIVGTEDHPIDWKSEPPETLAPDWSRSTLFPRSSDTPWPQPGQEQLSTVFAAGWPCRAFWCSPAPPPHKLAIHGGGLQLPRGLGGYPTSIPLRPLVSGLVINTILFSTAWCFILVAPSAWRRHHRRARNACLSCGYRLDGLNEGTPCPECGD